MKYRDQVLNKKSILTRFDTIDRNLLLIQDFEDDDESNSNGDNAGDEDGDAEAGSSSNGHRTSITNSDDGSVSGTAAGGGGEEATLNDFNKINDFKIAYFKALDKVNSMIDHQPRKKTKLPPHSSDFLDDLFKKVK
ncbi:unnamed protein product [Ambrosiozyma monospora]|uniref:Unnamed protein product n=1 Tax=Ambrosiozyma monospora TaxID=43982 RepID=A0ACB5T963_AMBMO|nr:unnamed protein product [Ambrosiozyma monospora]